MRAREKTVRENTHAHTHTRAPVLTNIPGCQDFAPGLSFLQLDLSSLGFVFSKEESAEVFLKLLPSAAKTQHRHKDAVYHHYTLRS